MNRGQLRKWAWLFVICAVILLPLNHADSQEVYAPKSLEGYWEGEFMPGNHLTMVIHFERSGDTTLAGRILVFQDGQEIQNDGLSKIVLEEGALQFFIQAKNTPFAGSLSEGGLAIKGAFEFPDGTTHPVWLEKVEKPFFLAGMEEDTEPSGAFERRYAPELLRRDLYFLKERLERVHPQLYLYTSRKRFDTLFQNVLKSIESEMIEDAFFRLLAPVVAQVHCSHTGIRLSEVFEQALNEKASLVPADIYYSDGKAYILEDFSHNPEIEKGMQVLSINGVAVSEILQRLLSCIPADGLNPSAQIYEINSQFPFVYSRYIGPSSSFTLECVDASASRVDMVFQGVSAMDLINSMKGSRPERFQQQALPLDLVMDQDAGTAVLTIHEFIARDLSQYKASLKSSFSSMRRSGIDHLIIDVRGNKGGHPFFAAELLSYLAGTSFTYFELPVDPGEFGPLYRPIQPKKEAFRGDVYVLADGGSLSTTGHFLSLVKYHKMGSLVGEPPGASFYSNDRSLQLTLPETKIRFNLPQTTYQTAVNGFVKGQPLLPDHLVSSSLEDRIEGRDKEMQYTYGLIEKRINRNKQD